uniref:Glycine cleavage system H protein n=1 Tax=Riptortus pedestris TaxID=329032 RepID=R4WKC4_RIPPE|nr:glycine cleavage system h protein [Riptortus pedestris]
MATLHLSHTLKSLAFNQPCLQQFFAFSCYTVKSIRLSNNLPLSRTYATGDKNRLYSDKHEWVQVDGNVGIVGISHHAQEALGDVVYAQLPDIGTEVSQHDEVGALESVKAASEVYSPVSGKVTEKNTSVEDSPSLINKSCYEKGWLFKICLSNPEELKSLMSEAKYEEFLKTSEH